VDDATAYPQQCQIADAAVQDASVVEYRTANLLRNWDTVNALKRDRDAATSRVRLGRRDGRALKFAHNSSIEN